MLSMLAMHPCEPPKNLARPSVGKGQIKLLQNTDHSSLASSCQAVCHYISPSSSALSSLMTPLRGLPRRAVFLTGFGDAAGEVDDDDETGESAVVDATGVPGISVPSRYA